MTSNEFLSIIKEYVIEDMKRSGILASLTAAQALLESSSGSSKLAQAPNHNLFGIKGNYNGQSVCMNTKEYVQGRYVTVKAYFKKYPSWYESIRDHSDMFNRLARYKNLRGEKDYKTACKNVQLDGYATAPNYAASLINVIEKFKLYQWDSEQPVEADAELNQAVDVIARRVIDGRFGYGHDNRSFQIYELIRQRVNDIISTES